MPTVTLTGTDHLITLDAAGVRLGLSRNHVWVRTWLAANAPAALVGDLVNLSAAAAGSATLHFKGACVVVRV